jgi:O-antigen/teichoic acid export membrane protein
MATRAAAPSPRPDPFSTLHLQKDLNRVSARGGVFTVASQVSVFTIQTLTMICLARLLGPYDFGLFAMVTSVTGFMLLFKDMGLSIATIQKTDITQAEVSVLFWINAAVSVLLALIILLLAPVLSWFYHEPKLFGIVTTLSIGFFIAGFGVQHQAILNRQMRFRAIALSDNISLFISSAIGLTCAWMGLRYWSLVAMQVGYFCVNTTMLWILSGWRPGRPAWHVNAYNMLTFGSHLTGGNVMNYVARNVDSFLIGRIWGPVALGYYGRAYQLLLMPTLQITAPIRSVAVPALSRLSDNPEKYREMCCNILFNMGRVSMPLITFMIATSDWLVNVILGPKWHPSAVIFACLGVATLLQPLSSSTVWVMVSQGRSRDVFVSQCFASLMTVTAIIIGLPWGGVGVAAAISTGELLVRTPYLFAKVGRSGPIRTSDMYRAFLAGLGSSLAVLLTVGLIRLRFTFPQSWEGLAVTAGPAAFVGLLVTYVLPGGREAVKQMTWFVATVRSGPAKAVVNP